MAQEESGWCTVESDPGLFTLLIERLGAKGVQVEELLDLESASLGQFSKVFGLIFLFKWDKHGEEGQWSSAQSANADMASSNVFFAQQVIRNACATLAILHILLNVGAEEASISLGKVLEDFLEFGRELPADMRGLCLSNSLELRQVHNEFGNVEDLLAFGEDSDEDGESKKKSLQRDPFHFVAFVPRDERVWELDGLRAEPLILDADSVNQKWYESVLSALRDRITRLSAGTGEIRFNLMALVPDERQELEQQLKALDDQIQNLEGTEQASVSLKRKRFETEQRLSDAQAKWTRYHAEFENRQLRSRQARAMPNAAAAPAIPNKLSAPVADLLEQMKAKGLFRNFGQ